MQWQQRFFARQTAMGRRLNDTDCGRDPFCFLRQKMQRENWSWWTHRLLHLLPGRRSEGEGKMRNANEEVVEQRLVKRRMLLDSREFLRKHEQPTRLRN